jgi:toxin FitB
MNDPADEKVVAWVERQPRISLCTTSITVLEIQLGLESMPAGKRRTRLSQVFELILEEIDSRIAVFDEEAARVTASLMASGQKKGRVRDLRDSMIAGVVLARNASLATRNTAHFSDVPATVVNPWDA